VASVIVDRVTLHPRKGRGGEDLQVTSVRKVKTILLKMG
jgi:hypothetical protein